MAIVEMSKLSIIGLNYNKNDILNYLMNLGCCELYEPIMDKDVEELFLITNKEDQKVEIGNLTNQLSKVEKALELLNECDNRKKKLFESVKFISKEEFGDIWERREELLLIAKDISDSSEKLLTLKSEKNNKLNLISMIENWKSLSMPVECSSTKKTIIQKGIVSNKSDIKKLFEELEDTTEEVYGDVIYADKEQSNILVICHNSFENEIYDILKKYSFEKMDFKSMKGTVAENIEALSKDIEILDTSLMEIENHLKLLVEEKDQLEIFYDYISVLIDKNVAIEKLVKTDKVFVLKGWIPTESQEQIENITMKWDAFVEVLEPDKDEDYPILLHNNKVGSSSEGVTSMYSLPNRKEIDPNAIMAPCFIFFFGLMLGDAGYGLVMAMASLFASRKYQFDEEKKRFFKLLFYCGISTTFWGAMFGSWFGSAYLSKYVIWFNPVEDPEELLRWSLLFGVIHVYMGLAVRGANLFRSKKYIDIFYDVFLWYVFFTGFIFFVLPYIPKAEPEKLQHLVQIGKYLLMCGGIMIVLTAGRKQKNIFMKLISGLGSLYDLISFMSDILSYSRLLALGLATSVIASIINQVCSMAGLDTAIKVIVFIVVASAGHVFNFAINALGAYVHSSRLQYIEFFGKFYEGGGVAFEPLQITTKYIRLSSGRDSDVIKSGVYDNG